MLILALDTTTDFGSCALWIDGELRQLDCPPGRPHSETLLPLVRQLMAEAGLAFSHLDGIAFGCGPGAFTGLRVACGVTQGLAVAWETPVVPVCSLASMASQLAATQVLALLDARMGEVYAARYENRVAGIAQCGDIRVVLPVGLELPSESGWHACGNAITAYPALAERLKTAGVAIHPDILPNAGAVARLAVPQLAAGKGIDAALAAPLYIRDKVAKTVAERLGEGGRA